MPVAQTSLIEKTSRWQQGCATQGTLQPPQVLNVPFSREYIFYVSGYLELSLLHDGEVGRRRTAKASPQLSLNDIVKWPWGDHHHLRLHLQQRLKHPSFEYLPLLPAMNSHPSALKVDCLSLNVLTFLDRVFTPSEPAIWDSVSWCVSPWVLASTLRVLGRTPLGVFPWNFGSM